MIDKLNIILRVIWSNVFLASKKLSGCRISYSIKSLISPKATLRTFGKGEICFGIKNEIRPNTEITARNGKIEIGNDCFINRNCMIVAHECIQICNNVTIGPGTCIYDHDHGENGGYTSSQITIKEGVWIGANAIILQGVTIGSRSIVAAGTIVNKDVPDKTLIYQKRENIQTEIR